MTERAERVVEVRCYTLKPGATGEFHRLATEAALLQRQVAGIDVKAFGSSLDGVDGYYLIRAFASVEELRAQESAFYSSRAWQDGPRRRVLDLIDHYASAAIALDGATVEGLRRPA